jgi:hypothetical protein
LAGRAPEKKHRRWASHRCPAVVALEAAQKKRQARRAFRPVCRHRKGSSYQCPGLKAALKPDKISALFRRSDVRAHVVAEGLDTLWLYTTHPIRPGGLARLAELLGRALETKAKVPVELAGVELHVQPKRLAASKVLLSNDFFDVMVAPLAEGDDEARARVECRAQGLWAMGWERCAQKAVELLEVLCGADAAALDVQVARADLCVDVQGWTPTVEDRPFFHTRARSKGRYYGTLVKEWDSDAWVELEVPRPARGVLVGVEPGGEFRGEDGEQRLPLGPGDAHRRGRRRLVRGDRQPPGPAGRRQGRRRAARSAPGHSCLIDQQPRKPPMPKAATRQADKPIVTGAMHGDKPRASDRRRRAR